MGSGIAECRADGPGADAALTCAESLVRAGYRRRPPRPLLAGEGGSTLFTSVADADWRRSLAGSSRPDAGGAVVLQWILNTSRLAALPSASPPSAGRTVGAVWVGARPYAAALRDVMEALGRSGAEVEELTFLLSAEPEDATRVRRGLLALEIARDRVVHSDRLPGAPSRMDPALGPCLTLRRPSGAPLFAHCGPGCVCGCHASVAHIQFVERRAKAGRLTAARQPLFEMVASEHGLTRPDGIGPSAPGGGVSSLLARLAADISAVTADAPTEPGPSSVFLADVSSAAVLLLGEGIAPGPRGRHHVLRRLIRTIGGELAVHGIPVPLLSQVIDAADATYRIPAGFSPLSVRSRGHVRDECAAFERVVNRGREYVMSSGLLSGGPNELARNLVRIRAELGVPLGLSLRWCREAGVEPPLASVAFEDLRTREDG